MSIAFLIAFPVPGVSGNLPPYPPEADQNFFVDGEIVPANDPVVVAVKAFVDPEGDNHVETYWRVWRSDRPSVEIEKTTGPGVLMTTFDLSPGLKYTWIAGFMDDGSGTISWSAEYSFIVGASSLDILPPVLPGVNIADFSIVSFTQWPDHPAAKDVFGIKYDPNLFRIGIYDPTQNGYLEFGPNLFIRPGCCYWVLARNGLDVTVAGVPVSTTVDVDVPLAYNASDGNGWNMVAPPNAAYYLWEDVEVIAFDPDGNPEFGPMPILMLNMDNPYIDLRFWSWENGAYTSHSPYDDPYLLRPNTGGWVRVRRDGVYLRFSTDRQLLGTNRSGAMTETGRYLLSTSLATAADYGLTPPGPMKGLGAIMPGDVNDSGTVNLIDAILALQMAGRRAASSVVWYADVDGDEKIGLSEAVYAIRVASGLYANDSMGDNSGEGGSGGVVSGDGIISP